MTKNEKQVQLVLYIAKRYNIPLAIRSGSHSYEPYCVTDCIVCDQSRRVNISITKNSVSIEPGCLNGPVAAELSKYNRVIAQGTCANVGVTGLCLSGGMGFLGRKYGLSCDNVISFKIFIANGQLLHVDRETYSDLFWACRGAGNANFGIITEMTVKTHSVSRVQVFEFRWHIDKLYQVLTVYTNWLSNDNSVGIEMDIFNTNLENPIMITGLYTGSKKKLVEYLQVFLDLNPSVEKIWETDYLDSFRHFTYQHFPPPFSKNKSFYVYRLLPESVVPIIKKYMKTAGPNDRVEINGLGSKYKKGDSSYPHKEAILWIQLITKWGTESLNRKNKEECSGWEDGYIAPKSIEWVTRFYNKLRAAGGDLIRGAYVGAFDAQLRNYLREYYGENLSRLREIKKKYDPENLFSYPQSIKY
jgi:hypothetical protein